MKAPRKSLNLVSLVALALLLATPVLAQFPGAAGTLGGQPAMMGPQYNQGMQQPGMPPQMNPYNHGNGGQPPMMLLQGSQNGQQDYRIGEVQGPNRAPAATAIDPCTQGGMGPLNVQGVQQASQPGVHY